MRTLGALPLALWAGLMPPVRPAGAPAGLEPCRAKPTFTEQRCPEGSVVACWSAVASAPWSCWAAADAPGWARSPLRGDAACTQAEVPLAGLPRYDGACAFAGGGGAPPRQLEAPPAGEVPLLRPLSWEAAAAKATDTVAQMSAGDKHKLLTGLGWDGDLRKWFYVGNTAAVPSLGIPSLNMQDAASGFRAYWAELVGTVTCWPSLLAMAATWDPDAVETYARAVGEEFKGKGANGILGPSVNVHRVARNGRNFEYLSGEDPYLGSVLTAAYVRGVQSQGVFAVMKHWVFNEQETNRDSENSVVDDKTAWELYYPPFQAAVDAGVSAAMCSYNRIGGQYSCANEETLQTVLKHQMGFRGFVQTDWWAAKAMGMPAGLDQEMPGSGDVFFTPEGLAGQDSQRVDDAVHRVLSVIYRLKLETSTPCSASGFGLPDCEEWFRKNVTSEAHASLARSLATESIVLLKNDMDVLPISTSHVGKIAVLGAASVADAYDSSGGGQNGGGDWATGDYYSGGGSGHVVAGRLITPLQGISSRAAAVDIEVASSPTDDIDAGLQAADGAELIIVVAATTSGESRDRESLALDGGVGDLIGAVSAHSGKRVVVLVQSPGAFVAPWRDSVAGILVMFLGGQETGAAWASILFGDRSPTGRLPLMLPATEDDQILPGTGGNIVYSEGTETSYRNHNFKAAFPFGHGLAFTTFEYTRPMAVPCGGQTTSAEVRRLTSEERLKHAVVCIQVRVRNAGKSFGQDVVQLYLDFPLEAGRPGSLLKGFQKTGVVAPGDAVEVVLPLTQRDLSYYDAGAKGWKEATSMTAHVGASSADLHATPVLLARDEASGEWQWLAPVPVRAPAAPAPAPAVRRPRPTAARQVAPPTPPAATAPAPRSTEAAPPAPPPRGSARGEGRARVLEKTPRVRIAPARSPALAPAPPRAAATGGPAAGQGDIAALPVFQVDRPHGEAPPAGAGGRRPTPPPRFAQDGAPDEGAWAHDEGGPSAPVLLAAALLAAALLLLAAALRLAGAHAAGRAEGGAESPQSLGLRRTGGLLGASAPLGEAGGAQRPRLAVESLAARLRAQRLAALHVQRLIPGSLGGHRQPYSSGASSPRELVRSACEAHSPGLGSPPDLAPGWASSAGGGRLRPAGGLRAGWPPAK